MHAARREALRIEPEVADHVPREALRVGLVVDAEAARVSEPVGVGAQDPHAGGVERADPHLPGDRPDQLRHALAHLLGGLVGERDREDLHRVHALVDEVRDAMREHPGLAGAGAGDDEQRSVPMDHGVELVRVEAVEVDRRAYAAAARVLVHHRRRRTTSAGSSSGSGTGGSSSGSGCSGGCQDGSGSKSKSEGGRHGGGHPTNEAVPRLSD